MRRVTFSRNFTLSLSRTCQCYCKYCAFATHQAHIHAPEEVERQLDEALKRNAKELLVLTGERPEVNPVVAERLKTWGHDDFTSYVVWACERALERGMLPHTNIGVLDKEDLARLREVTASQGLMLESVSERLMETVHAGSPDQAPGSAAGDDRSCGRAEDPLHQRHPRRHRRDARKSGSNPLKPSRQATQRHGHLQEVILQNFVPHPRYYGAEVAEIADDGLAKRWRAMGVALRRSSSSLLPEVHPHRPCRLGESRLDRGDQAADSGVQTADAGCWGAGAAEPVGVLA